VLPELHTDTKDEVRFPPLLLSSHTRDTISPIM